MLVIFDAIILAVTTITIIVTQPIVSVNIAWTILAVLEI